MDDFLEAFWAWFPGSSALGRTQRPLGFLSFFFHSLSEGIFSILEGFCQVLASQNRTQNRFLEDFCSVFFANAISASIIGRF